MTLAELRAKLEGVKKNIRKINDLATKEKRELSDDETTKLDELLDEAETLTTEVEEKAQEEQRAADAKREREARLKKLVPGGSRSGGPGSGGSNFHTPDVEPRSDDPVDNPDPSKYKFMRAVEAIAQGRVLDGYEGEVSQEIAHRSNRSANGFFMPLNLPMMHAEQVRSLERRTALNTTTAAGAIENHTANRMIDYLRNQTVLTSLGAQIITGVIGELDIPKETNEGSYYWVGEATDVGEDSATIGEVQLRQKTIGAWITATRRMRSQTSLDMDLFMRRRLMRSLAIGIDKAGINGSGSSGQPQGIMQKSGIPKVTIGTDGGALAWSKVVDLETLVAAANADIGNLAYLASAPVRGHMKVTQKASNTARFLWDEQTNMVNGYQAKCTNQIPTNLTKGAGTNLSALIFGDFSAMIFAFWSGVDITVDTNTLHKQGGLVISALQDCDFNIERDGSFAICSEVNTAS